MFQLYIHHASILQNHNQITIHLFPCTLLLIKCRSALPSFTDVYGYVLVSLVDNMISIQKSQKMVFSLQKQINPESRFKKKKPHNSLKHNKLKNVISGPLQSGTRTRTKMRTRTRTRTRTRICQELK